MRNGQSGPSALRLATVESGGESRKLLKELRRAEMAVRVRRTRRCAIKTNVEVILTRTNWARKVWPKMTKHAIFAQNFAVLVQNIIIFTGDSKSFGTHITEKPPRHLVCIVFWSGMGSNGPKMPIFGQKCQF